MTQGRLPVEFIKMSPWDKILCQWLCVTNTLDAWVHEACVSQVTQTCGPLFCRNWNKQHENGSLAVARCHDQTVICIQCNDFYNSSNQLNGVNIPLLGLAMLSRGFLMEHHWQSW